MIEARVKERLRAIGLADLVVVLFGVLLGPLVHSIGHRPDHVHGPGGVTHYGVLPFSHEDAHARGLAHAHPGDPSQHRHAPADHGHPVGSPVEHGEGSLAHFGVAVLAPPLFAVRPTEGSLLVAAPVAPMEAPAVAERRSSAQARAPPA